MDIMERLGPLSGMAGFRAYGLPLAAGLKSMVNLGVDGGLLTDAGFTVL